MPEANGKVIVGRESVADNDGKAGKVDPSLDKQRLRLTVNFPPGSIKRLNELKELLEARSHVDVLRASLNQYNQ